MAIIPGVASPYVQPAVSFALETPRDSLQIDNPPGGGVSDMHHVDAQDGIRPRDRPITSRWSRSQCRMPTGGQYPMPVAFSPGI